MTVQEYYRVTSVSLAQKRTGHVTAHVTLRGPRGVIEMTLTDTLFFPMVQTAPLTGGPLVVSVETDDLMHSVPPVYVDVRSTLTRDTVNQVRQAFVEGLTGRVARNLVHTAVENLGRPVALEEDPQSVCVFQPFQEHPV